jgi:hypothetical protein
VLDVYQYIAVGPSEFESAINVYLTWLAAFHGLSVDYVSTESIYSDYSGTDDAEKLRNAVIDFYSTYDTEIHPAGGRRRSAGTTRVPHRGMYGYVNSSSGAITDEDIPADLYFAALDGTWDGDGDGIWGESNDGAAAAKSICTPMSRSAAFPATASPKSTGISIKSSPTRKTRRTTAPCWSANNSTPLRPGAAI